MLQWVIIFFMLFSLSCEAQPSHRFNSGVHQVRLLELYTSEGCSSCPAADRWLSQFKTHPTLWQAVIPVAWHVDYWDDIGWQDPWALPGNSERQRRFAAEARLSSVYTPSFVVDGAEWQGWFQQVSLPVLPMQMPGNLSLDLTDNDLQVQFAGKQERLDYHFVVLGFGLRSQVKAGENKGRLLQHDFVALVHQVQTAANNRMRFSLDAAILARYQVKALLVWVNRPDSLVTVQVVGGKLP